MPCCHTYRPQPIKHVRETMLRIKHCNSRWSSQIRTWFATSQDYQTRQLTTKEGNLSGPIRTGHNQHTHTGNTHQPELNLRVPRVHLSSRAQLEGCHSELNSRNTTCLTLVPSSTQGTHFELNPRNISKLIFEVSLKPCRSHNHTAKHITLVPPDRLVLLSRRQALLLSDRLAGDTYHQAPSAFTPLPLHLSPSGTLSTIRCHEYKLLSESQLSPSDFISAAMCCISTVTVLVFEFSPTGFLPLPLYQTNTGPYLIAQS
ncbi:hypothetical protein DEO72_LG11g1880 [Vigna unguiculata]|nr:hypothetical protein DEO72_LG11g1880 [Vigna unguiculata]